MEILVLIVLNIALHWRTLKNQLIVDDVHHKENIDKGYYGNPNFKDFVISLPRRLYGFGTFYTGKSEDKEYNKRRLLIEHCVRIFLNVTIAVLMYLVLGKNTVSLWAAILYTCNPINNQTAIWFNGRRYAVNVILTLAMVGLGAWGLLLYPLTFLFQMTAFFTPILIAPWALLAVPVMLFVARKDLKNRIDDRLKTLPDLDRRNFTPKRLIVITKYYGHYFFKMIVPGWCSFYYPNMFYWGRTAEGNKDAYSFNWQFLRGATALTLSIAGLFFFKGQMTCFWAFMCLATLQWSAIIPVIGDMSDRYVSLANVFMMFFVSYLINTYAGIYAMPALVGIAVYYTMNLFTVMQMYRSFPDFWQYHRYHSPKVPMPLNTEAKYYLDTGDPQKALVLLLDGLKQSPEDFNLLRLTAGCCNAFNDHKLALQFALRAKEKIFLYHEKQEKLLDVFIGNLQNAVEKARNIIPAATLLGEKSRQVKRQEAREAAKRK